MALSWPIAHHDFRRVRRDGAGLLFREGIEGQRDQLKRGRKALGLGDQAKGGFVARLGHAPKLGDGRRDAIGLFRALRHNTAPAAKFYELRCRDASRVCGMRRAAVRKWRGTRR